MFVHVQENRRRGTRNVLQMYFPFRTESLREENAFRNPSASIFVLTDRYRSPYRSRFVLSKFLSMKKFHHDINIIDLEIDQTSQRHRPLPN